MPAHTTSLPIPESQAEVPSCLAETRRHIARLTAELEAARQHIRSIQKVCEHPKERQHGGRDISGVYSTLCEVCGLDR
jgi:hypothetical protein